MSQLTWDKIGERYFETGVSHGTLYIPNAMGLYVNGYAWNGLTGVTASPSGAEATKQYADNIAYLNMTSAEEYGGTIEAFQSPREFDQCDGVARPIPGLSIGQQTRKSFGFSWQTLIGNDIDGQDHAYKIHVAYGAQAAPSEKAYATVNESPEAVTLSWTFTTTPAPISPEIIVEGRALKPTAYLAFDSRDFSPAKMQELKDILYGTASTNPRLPSPRELITIMQTNLTEVEPQDPTFDDTDNELVIPAQTGVVYLANGVVIEGTHILEESVTITAIPAPGYKFANVVQTQWAIIAS